MNDRIAAEEKRLESLALNQEIPKDLAEAKKQANTPEFNNENQIRRYLQKKYGITANLDGMNFDVAKAFAEEVDLVLSSMIGRTNSLEVIDDVLRVFRTVNVATSATFFCGFF